MSVLIVEEQAALAEVWKGHLERMGSTVSVATNVEDAGRHLEQKPFKVIILDLMLGRGHAALAVADLAQYRQPEARVIFVTNTSFFSDGSIFRHCSNACAFVPSHTRPDDLAAMVQHYAGT
ncbi:response regulator [Thalassococcus lentus]|uniref:Response regulator n=1 Tax=Thalassococcus lentus TaxID=1210524 RepID=A0ABT4XT98_9RHOB|nr:response regulator [Thalassococcus lentus]MDA7425132.1 response regulator [Thalassococcus lentus]